MSNQVQSTGDIRSKSIDKKRAVEDKHKWQPKWQMARNLPTFRVVNGKKRPVAGDRHDNLLVSSSKRYTVDPRREDGLRKLHAFRKQDHLASDRATLDEDSTDGDSSQGTASPEFKGIDEIAFSYDAPRGPSSGSQILEVALNKAVERFEDHTTTKLVKDEYEVLDNESDDDAAVAHADMDDDDFELV